MAHVLVIQLWPVDIGGEQFVESRAKSTSLRTDTLSAGMYMPVNIPFHVHIGNGDVVVQSHNQPLLHSHIT